MDTGHERTLRGAGVWAIHVESSRQILREWNGLYVEHDIQYAAATDGGRQVDDKGRHVASSAGVLDNGCVVGGALDPHKDARSSYETELQARKKYLFPPTLVLLFPLHNMTYCVNIIKILRISR